MAGIDPERPFRRGYLGVKASEGCRSCRRASLHGIEEPRNQRSWPPKRIALLRRLQRSNPTSVPGRAQQISTFPSAGGSSGSGSYRTVPLINAHSHVWQTPVRHDHFTGTSQASANSSRLWYAGFHDASTLLRAKETIGPGPGAPAGRCGGSAGAFAIPGVTASSGPKTSWCNRSLATPQRLRSWVKLRRNVGGPQR